MHKTNKKHNKLKKLITATTLLILLTNCTTTKHRDLQLSKTLKLQNETISSLIASRKQLQMKTKRVQSDADKKSQQQLLKALNALKKSNTVVIDKLKPNKKECNCGKNERVND